MFNNSDLMFGLVKSIIMIYLIKMLSVLFLKFL